MAMLNHDEQYVYETIKLQPDEEYRIYLKPKEWIRVWMVHGSAEIFGTELREAKRNEKFNNPYSSHRHHSSKHKKHHNKMNKSSKSMTIDEINSNTHDREEMYYINDSYLFSNANISIFTYNGCTLYIKYERGSCEHKFATREAANEYLIYCNYNAALVNMRRAAELHVTQLELENKLLSSPKLPRISADVLRNDFSLNEHKILDLEIMKQISTYGPRVLILGPSNSGKASLCKILSNYGLRSSYYPILIDLDCSLNMISIPGTIAGVTITEPIDVCNGFNHSINNGNENGGHGNKLKGNKNKQKESKERENDMNEDMDEQSIKELREISPVIYFYGDDHPDRRLKVYEKCVEKLSLSIKKKLIVNLRARTSGIIVKCHGCCSTPSVSMKNLINNIIKLFHINVILCIDDELTLNYLRHQKYSLNISQSNHINYSLNESNCLDLSSYWKNRFIAIEKCIKSGGVIVREQAERLALGRNIIRNYFYGPNENKPYRPLSCETLPIFLKIYQIGSGQTQNDLLPADQRSVVESFGVLPVRFDSSLRGQILAILHIDNGINEKEQYQIERDIQTISAHNSHSSGADGQTFNILNLIEYDDENENIMYNHQTQQQISTDPFENNNKLKNKLIRSSNVMGFVHVQEIKYDPHNRSVISKLTLLNPCQNKIPQKCLLKGHINWHDR